MMPQHWTAIVLTCPDQKTAIAYQNGKKTRSLFDFSFG